MKLNVIRLTILMGLLALSLPSAHATILYDSELTAPPLTAGNLVGQDGWYAHSGGGAKPIQVSAAGTTVVQSAGSGEDISVPIAPISAGQIYYFGFDAVVTGSSTNVYFAHFKDAANGTDFTTRTFVTAGPVGSDFTFGLSATTSAPDVTFPTGFAFGSTNRVVGSYSAIDNQIKLWVNPTEESSTSIAFTDPAAHPTAAFSLRQSTGGNTQVISNLVVATTFNEAAGIIPEPTTISLMLVSVGAMLFRRK
jgi:hypothetical protein